MKQTIRLWTIGACLCALSTACVRSNDGSDATMLVTGSVTDENAVALANAKITIGSVVAVTDAAGHYSLTPTGQIGESQTAVVAAEGFGRRTQPVAYDALHKTYDFVLRHNDAATTFLMPTVGQAAAVVSATRGAGGFSLTIPANSLVHPDGTSVTGQVAAALTYWHPDETLDHAPAPLYGTDARDPDTGLVSLLSYGMADIVLSQGNDVLQVAPGKTLDLAFTLPDVYAEAAAQTDKTADDAPHLWVADETTGMWTRVGDQQDGTLVYDANRGVMLAHLPHLSSWNLDGKMTTNACVRGRLVDCRHTPVANAQAWLWVMGKGQVGHWPIQTAADGSYCTNIAGTSRDIRRSNATYDSSGYVWVSLPKLPDASVCNPTGISNVSELCAQGHGSSTICRTEEVDPPFYKSGVARCATLEPVLTSCGYCQGTRNPGGRCTVRDSRNTSGDGTPGTSFNVGYTQGGCTVLPDMMLPTGTCPNSTTPPDACANKGSTLGIVCASNADCCPNSQLECADAHCVPRTSAE